MPFCPYCGRDKLDVHADGSLINHTIDNQVCKGSGEEPLLFHAYVRNRKLNVEGFLVWDYGIYTQPTTDFADCDVDFLAYDPSQSVCSRNYCNAMHCVNDDYPYKASEGWEISIVPIGYGTCWPKEGWVDGEGVPSYFGAT